MKDFLPNFYVSRQFVTKNVHFLQLREKSKKSVCIEVPSNKKKIGFLIYFLTQKLMQGS